MNNAKLLYAQQPVISQETCNVLAHCKLWLHLCSFDASVLHDAVNNFHFPLNFATVYKKWKIYAQLHNKQTKYWKWTIHSHLQNKQAHIKVCYEWHTACGFWSPAAYVCSCCLAYSDQQPVVVLEQLFGQHAWKSKVLGAFWSERWHSYLQDWGLQEPQGLCQEGPEARGGQEAKDR